MWETLPYHASVLDDFAVGPDIVIVPDRGREGRGAVPLPPPAGNFIRDDPAGTAHEVAAEAFVRLLSRWPRVDNPQSYLYMVATNLIRDHWRKAERERRAIRSGNRR